MKKILLSIMLAGSMLNVPAQQLSEKQQAVALLQSVAEHYRSSKGLHGAVQYRYASEGSPSIWLDSLKGDFAINGDLYRYSLDSTEFIGGKELSVILFKQDQLMYLVKGSGAMQRGNPIALLDSMILKNDSVDCTIRQTADWQAIILSFRPGGTTKRMEYIIDRHTGFITRVISVVAARELYDPSVQQKVEGNDAYAIVETNFTDYRLINVTEKEWDLSRLFKKEGKEYTPLPPYGSYKIFLGSPDL